MAVWNRFEVSDDSGFMALVDPHAYEGFVGSDWTLESLFERFRDAMARRSLLIWGTGREGLWKVDVSPDGSAAAGGFRQVSGPIRVSAGRLHLTNYESLTMAAQFPDVRLPEPHSLGDVVSLPVGDYVCGIVQVRAPDDYAGVEAGADTAPDFLLSLRGSGPAEPWTGPAWWSM